MDKLVWAASASNGTLSSQPYRFDIDGLRAVAVSAVIAYHFWDDLLPGGFLGVDMFFVISGHVITAPLSKHAGSFHELFLDFYCRRIKRLLPALLVCVTVTSLIGSLFIHPQSKEYSDSMRAGLFAVLGLSNIHFFRETSDYFGNLASLNLFTHTWSLGVEDNSTLYSRSCS
jgi:peptidoglycan/LPS O-acetylase OafA/YrhL